MYKPRDAEYQRAFEAYLALLESRPIGQRTGNDWEDIAAAEHRVMGLRMRKEREEMNYAQR